MTQTNPNPHRWRISSIALIVSAWAILQLGGLFTPGLLDDVDSIYIQIAREMLQRHNYITPTIDGIRFFDKPPLMYWMAAGSMHLFGIHDWAARLPLALGVLALLLAVYALGIRFYSPTAATKLSPSAQDPGAPGPASGTRVHDRAGLYAALAMATCIGPYLYTRFYIPDILIALWMTLSVHLFLIALERINQAGTNNSHQSKPSPSAQDSAHPAHDANSPLWQEPVARRFSVGSHRSDDEKGASAPKVSSSYPPNSDTVSHPQNSVILSAARSAQPKDPDTANLATTANPFLPPKSALLPCLGFAAVTALNLLTKGFIGIVFPLGFALLYLAFTRQLRLLAKLHLIPSTIIFLIIAAPWHILAAIRNPPIPMPAGVGLPAHAGWAWFYLYNEHIARFLGRRIPHDYGQVPIPIFWALLLLWLFPWVAFLPAALLDAYRTLRTPTPGDPSSRPPLGAKVGSQDLSSQNRHREAALANLLWAGIILGFFTLSSRQEYYHLPALPALALLVGGLLAAADAQFTTTLRARQETLAARAEPSETKGAPFMREHLAHGWGPQTSHSPIDFAKQALNSALYGLVPLGTLLFLLCTYFYLTAPTPHPGLTLNDALSSNPALYDLSLGHIFDLTSQAMGFFRGPLLTVALCMLALGPIAYLIRRPAAKAANGSNRSLAANLLIAAAMIGTLTAAHTGLVRFYPILGSKNLAQAIDAQYHPGDLIIIDGELTSGSTLLFYTPRTAAPILLVNGRINGPWFGSFYPDAPNIFLNDAQLAHLWHGPHRIFLLTHNPKSRTTDLTPYAPVQTFATSAGKTILTNR